jgi:hypothetical protein
MGRQNSWKRAASNTPARKFKKWFKITTRRKNRRAAKRDPEAKDKKLDSWSFD